MGGRFTRGLSTDGQLESFRISINALLIRKWASFPEIYNYDMGDAASLLFLF